MSSSLKTDLIPAKEPGSRRLMVILHGLSDSMEGMRWIPEALQLPWMSYLLVNAPDPYYSGFSWYDFAHDPAPGIARSRELLFALLDNLREKGFPSEETILSGFSQGCLMSIEVGLRYPRRLAGIVGISGHVWQAEELARQLPPAAREQRLLVTHGARDPIIAIEPVRRQIAVLQQAQVRIDWREFVKGHVIAGETEMKVIRDFISQSYL